MNTIKKFFLNFLIAALLLSMAKIDIAWQFLGAVIVAILSVIIPKPKSYNRTYAGAAFNIQTADARENYRTAIHLIAEANGLMVPDGKGGMKPDISKIDRTQLTQGYLCTMCDVNAQTQQMQFTVVDTQQVSGSPVLPIMRLLSMQDSFVVGSMSYFLYIHHFNGGNQQNPSYTTLDFVTPYTYPSQTHDNELLGTGLQGFDPGMSLFWNPGAYISIEVDKKVVVPYWDCLKHLYVPETQANATAAVVGGPPFQWPVTQDQYDGSTDAYFPVEPTIVLGGGRQNIIKLNLPANVPATIAPFTSPAYNETFVVKAVLMFHGILAQNSTSVK